MDHDMTFFFLHTFSVRLLLGIEAITGFYLEKKTTMRPERLNKGQFHTVKTLQ